MAVSFPTSDFRFPPSPHLYIHIPFCARACPYCSFYKSPLRAVDVFIESLLREARARGAGMIPRTIFIGGGTPTILNSRQLTRLCSGLREIFDCTAVEEWTIEINPTTLDEKKATALLSLGINRASLGVQSWNDSLLHTLGRIHTATQARESYDTLVRAGFSNINMDFIFAIPGQTLEDWRHTLEETIALAPQHISAYALTYEEDTEFFKLRNAAATNPEEAEMFDLTEQMLPTAGIAPYETSNFAREGFECRHNRAIWQGSDYLGLGPSATSTIARHRRKNRADTADYISAITPNFDVEFLDEEAWRIERIALGLRTREGIPATLLDTSKITRLLASGHLIQFDDRIALAPKSRALADSLIEELI